MRPRSRRPQVPSAHNYRQSGGLHAVLTTIQRDVAPVEFATWLENTTLLDVDEERQTVVVGTPHVFARDAVEQRYLMVLATKLSAQLGQPYALQVVIESG